MQALFRGVVRFGPTAYSGDSRAFEEEFILLVILHRDVRLNLYIRAAPYMRYTKKVSLLILIYLQGAIYIYLRISSRGPGRTFGRRCRPPRAAPTAARGAPVYLCKRSSYLFRQIYVSMLLYAQDEGETKRTRWRRGSRVHGGLGTALKRCRNCL